MAKITFSKCKPSSNEIDEMLRSDTTEFVSMDTNTPADVATNGIADVGLIDTSSGNVATNCVSKDTVSADTSVSLDTILSESSVSKDTIWDSAGVSKDTSRSAYQREFRKKRYKTVSLDMRPDEVERFRECASNCGLSMTEFFRRAANAYIVSLDTLK